MEKYSSEGFDPTVIWSEEVLEPISVELKKQYPNEPWRWRTSWESCRICTGCSKTLAVSVVLAIAWNAISWLWYGSKISCLLQEGSFWNSQFLALLIFPLAGIGLVGWALFEAKRFLTVGDSLLILHSNPGRIGGNFCGHVENNKLEPDKLVELSLICISRETKRGEYRTTHEDVLWQSTQTVRSNRLMSSDDKERATTVIPFQFAIPANRRQCCVDATSADGVSWVLRLAKVESTSLSQQVGKETGTVVASFEVPIFSPDLYHI